MEFKNLIFHLCDSKITSHLEFYVSYLAFYVLITLFLYYIGSIGTASFYGTNVRPLRLPRVRPGKLLVTLQFCLVGLL